MCGLTVVFTALAPASAPAPTSTRRQVRTPTSIDPRSCRPPSQEIAAARHGNLARQLLAIERPLSRLGLRSRRPRCTAAVAPIRRWLAAGELGVGADLPGDSAEAAITEAEAHYRAEAQRRMFQAATSTRRPILMSASSDPPAMSAGALHGTRQEHRCWRLCRARCGHRDRRRTEPRLLSAISPA